MVKGRHNDLQPISDIGRCRRLTSGLAGSIMIIGRNKSIFTDWLLAIRYWHR